MLRIAVHAQEVRGWPMLPALHGGDKRLREDGPQGTPSVPTGRGDVRIMVETSEIR